MARLPVNDKVALGAFIIRAATDDALREELLDNTNDKATELLAKYVTYPSDVDAKGVPIQHRIVVHADTEYETHIVLPTKADVLAATNRIQEQVGGMYPTQYIPGSPDYIDEAKFPLVALQFRFGEYTFGRCKH
jgi:hypothetical protein